MPMIRPRTLAAMNTQRTRLDAKSLGTSTAIARILSGARRWPDILARVDLRRAIRDNGVAVVLTAILVLVVADDIRRLLAGYPIGVDLEIPLRAAERWLAGGDPYPASAFSARTGGPDLPFLYPPFVLPLIAPLTFLPRALVFVAWAILLVGAAYASARRLGFGVIVAGVVLLWPPYLEALLGGNIQILLFAAYVVLMHHATGSQLDPADRERPAAVDGLLGCLRRCAQGLAGPRLALRPATAAGGGGDRSSSPSRCSRWSRFRWSGSTSGSTGSRRPAAPATRRGRTSGRRSRSSSVCRSPSS